MNDTSMDVNVRQRSLQEPKVLTLDEQQSIIEAILRSKALLPGHLTDQELRIILPKDPTFKQFFLQQPIMFRSMSDPSLTMKRFTHDVNMLTLQIKIHIENLLEQEQLQQWIQKCQSIYQFAPEPQKCNHCGITLEKWRCQKYNVCDLCYVVISHQQRQKKHGRTGRQRIKRRNDYHLTILQQSHIGPQLLVLTPTPTPNTIPTS
jgi:hypothetical protein